ncbi:MAG: 2-oxo acid dehydrogenase subunit E2 [Spirochaetales bacterium]|nr:2-oxo acid dehydrogenase subunit E2 [Spirochaetales bacterium]
MAEHVLMLALSPTMEEGTIVKWHKSEGDAVAQSELLCEVETDKATMEYESANEGTLLKILVPDGGQAKVGEPIAIVGSEGEDITALVEEARQARPEAAEPAGAEAAVEAPGAQGGPAVAPAAAAPAAPAAGPAAGGLKASPLARKLAAEMGVDLGTVRGSGPGGRIVKRDLEKVGRGGAPSAARAPRAAGAAGAAGIAGPAVEAAAGFGAAVLRDERVPVSGKRKVIAERLVKSKFSAPHYYLRMDIAVDALLEARRRLNERLGPQGKVSLNAFLLKLVAEALKRHPQVNASWEGDSILRHGSIDLGLAVALEDGLITPVVRDCGSKGVLAIDRELSELVEKARSNRLAPEEYSGATFTVTSLGSAGILEFTAIINPPGSAILAVGRIHKAPVVGDDDQIRVQSTMIVTLSCDHRVIDGAVGAAFLGGLKRMIENPIEALY